MTPHSALIVIARYTPVGTTALTAVRGENRKIGRSEMNKSEEALREEIKKHPKSMLAKAYRLGYADCIESLEISFKVQEEEPLVSASVIKKRGKHRIYSW